MEPYLCEIEIDSVKVGSLPPTLRSARFADSNVFGEFKINTNLNLVAPEAQIDARVVLSVCGMKLSLPVRLHDVTAQCDTQLIIRASETHGLTMVGIMLNENLELSYGLTVCGIAEVTSFPMVLRYVNHAINDSLWWMRKPHKLSVSIITCAYCLLGLCCLASFSRSDQESITCRYHGCKERT